VSDTIYWSMLGALLLSLEGDGLMSRKKRSAAGRGRLTIDVGKMKPDLDAMAQRHGITLSELSRDAFRRYQHRETVGVRHSDLIEHLLYLSNFDEAYRQWRYDTGNPSKRDDLQQAFDLVHWNADYLRRKNSP